MNKYWHKRIFAQLFTVLLTSAILAAAEACYDDLKLPRLIAQKNDEADTYMMAIAKADSLNAIFVGGTMNG